MKMEYDSEADEALDDIFGDEDTYTARVAFTTEYAAAVNFGGEPHWPPLRPMFKWTDRMGWENYGLDRSMTEDQMWSYVDDRRDARKPLPAAFLLASHIAEEGTEAMYYASDAFAKAQADAGSWAASNVDENTPLSRVARDFANYSLELAMDNLNERVSSATTGSLLASAQPAELVEG